MKKTKQKGLKATPLLAAIVAFAVGGLILLQFSSAGPRDVNDVDYTLADTNGDDRVNIIDLSYLLQRWDTSTDEADFTGDGRVNVADLSYMLAQWMRHDDPEHSFESYTRDIGPLANEAHIASNADWTWESDITNSGTDKFSAVLHSSGVVAQNTNYLWAVSFKFSDHNAGGFIGLDTRASFIDGPAAVMTVSQASTAHTYGNTVENPITAEGGGVELFMPYNWRLATDYEVIVERDIFESDEQYNWWTGFVYDKKENVGLGIGRVRAPVEWGMLVPHNSFAIRFGEEVCGQLGLGIFEVTGLRASHADGLRRPTGLRVEQRQYDDCANIMNVTSLEDGYQVRIDAGTAQ